MGRFLFIFTIYYYKIVLDNNMTKYRLTESRLRSLINEVVSEVINEESGYEEMLRRNKEVSQKTQEVLQYIKQMGYNNSSIEDYGKIAVSFDNQFAYDESERVVSMVQRFLGNGFSVTPRLTGPFNSYLILHIN